jgi:hypothetical protein
MYPGSHGASIVKFCPLGCIRRASSAGILWKSGAALDEREQLVNSGISNRTRLDFRGLWHPYSSSSRGDLSPPLALAGHLGDPDEGGGCASSSNSFGLRERVLESDDFVIDRGELGFIESSATLADAVNCAYRNLRYHSGDRGRSRRSTLKLMSLLFGDGTWKILGDCGADGNQECGGSRAGIDWTWVVKQ